MNLKNIEFINSKNYIDDLVKSLSNFCNKSPLKPVLKVIKDMNLIYVCYNNKELEIKININQNKKDVIGKIKKELEKEYPIIYKKTNCVPNVNDIRKLLNSGKTLEEALNDTKIEYEPLFKVIRCHDKYNELDVINLSDGEMYKFKCRIPLVSILEDLKYRGKDSDVLENINQQKNLFAIL